MRFAVFAMITIFLSGSVATAATTMSADGVAKTTSAATAPHTIAAGWPSCSTCW
jgi:hypothetical protein